MAFVKHAIASPLYNMVASRLHTSALNPRWDQEWGVETFNILWLRWDLLPLDPASKSTLVPPPMLSAEVARSLPDHFPSLSFFSPYQGSENDLGLLWAIARTDDHETFLVVGTASFDVADDLAEEQLRGSLLFLASVADTTSTDAMILGSTGSHKRNGLVKALGWSTSSDSKTGSYGPCVLWRPRRFRLTSSERLSLRDPSICSSTTTSTEVPCQAEGLLAQFTLTTRSSSGNGVAGNDRLTTMVSPAPGLSSRGSGERELAISPPSSTALSSSGLLTPAQEMAHTPLQPNAFSAITPDPTLNGRGNSSGNGNNRSHAPSAHTESSRSPPPLRQRIKRKRGPTRDDSTEGETSALNAPSVDCSRSCRIVRPRPNPAPDDSFTQSKIGTAPPHELFVGVTNGLAHRGGTDDSDDEDDDDDEVIDDNGWRTYRSLPAPNQPPDLAQLPYRLAAFEEEGGDGGVRSQEYAVGASLSPPPLPRASDPHATSLHSSTAAAAALAAASVASAMSLASPIASQQLKTPFKSRNQTPVIPNSPPCRFCDL